MKTDEEYRKELKELVNKNVISICAKLSKHSIEVADLEKWIYLKTEFLNSHYKLHGIKLTLSTRIFYILNDIKNPLRCKNENCNKLVLKNINIKHGCSGYCSNKCAKSSLLTKNKRIETNKKKFNVEYPAQNPEILLKMQDTCMKHFGFLNPGSSPIIKKKVMETCIKRFGVPYSSQSKEHKLYYSNQEFVKNIIKKQNATKQKNNSFNRSISEDLCYDLLKEKFPNTIRQYNSEKYPFNCDFYIPEKDLYIEFNGTWTHGRHAFDPTNEDDLNLVKVWEEKGTAFYKGAIDNWTRRDVLKREIAKKNGLNFLEFWNLNEVKEWLNTQSVNI